MKFMMISTGFKNEILDTTLLHQKIRIADQQARISIISLRQPVYNQFSIKTSFWSSNKVIAQYMLIIVGNLLSL